MFCHANPIGNMISYVYGDPEIYYPDRGSSCSFFFSLKGLAFPTYISLCCIVEAMMAYLWPLCRLRYIHCGAAFSVFIVLSTSCHASAELAS